MNPMKDFNLQCFLDAAKELLRSDETIRALKLLDNLPGYYRANPPREVTELKNKIHSRIATTVFYANDIGFESQCDLGLYETYNEALRSKLIVEDLKCFPGAHVIDYGPGEFWLPYQLNKNGCEFTYEPLYLNPHIYNHNKEHFEKFIGKANPDKPKIFVACEIIEHLWNENEIRFEMLRSCGLADIIHISTPHETYNTDCMHWENIGTLGHLRTYTANELSDVITQMFPEYEWTHYISQPQHMRGVRRDKND